MKARTTPAKRAPRATHKNRRPAACNLPRLFLFLEVFVEKEIPHRSLK